MKAKILSYAIYIGAVAGLFLLTYETMKTNAKLEKKLQGLENIVDHIIGGPSIRETSRRVSENEREIKINKEVIESLADSLDKKIIEIEGYMFVPQKRLVVDLTEEEKEIRRLQKIIDEEEQDQCHSNHTD